MEYLLSVGVVEVYTTCNGLLLSVAVNKTRLQMYQQPRSFPHATKFYFSDDGDSQSLNE